MLRYLHKFGFCAAFFIAVIHFAYAKPIDGGGTFDPFLMAFKPALQMSPLPAWMEQPARIDEENAAVEIPIPPLWKQPLISMYALTLVFDDSGDGGPVLEWRSPESGKTTISYGLGELNNKVGLNSRTVLIPEALTREGGTLIVRYRSHFDAVMSLAVRPARENSTAVLGSRLAPALVDENSQVYEDREVSGIRLNPLTGDLRKGTIVEAELSASVEHLEDTVEFLAPIDGEVEGSTIRLDALGLDPEAKLEVQINNKTAGIINFPCFELDDPSLVTDWNGRLILAGWRKGSLFVPARFFVAGENSISISLKRSEMETHREVYLRNTAIHMRFAPRPFTMPAPNTKEMNSAEVPSLSKPDFSIHENVIPGQ
jgi:hypothetical protein